MTDGKTETADQPTVENLNDFSWRMHHLYHIIDDKGSNIKFTPRYVQEMILKNLWFRNVILKARKHGTTTLVDLMLLDRALFSPNQDCQIISETMMSASRIFRRIVKHAYDNLPIAVKEMVPTEGGSATQMVFANKSIISVGTSARSTTPHALHISEYGPIASKYPEKAREILTGAIQAVSTTGNQVVFVESTAKGRGGLFNDMVDRAVKLQLSKTKLNKLDMKLLFFPWYEKPDNRVIGSDEPINDQMKEYFEKLNVKLTLGQKQWYQTQYDILGPDMLSENPSTPDEPFAVSIEGAYFSHQFKKIYRERRICKLDIIPDLPVHTSWDIGMHDYMAIWFWQIVDGWAHAVDYYENNDQGLPFYVQILEDRNYRYGTHYAPHDINVKEVGPGKTRIQQAQELGLRFKIVPKVNHKMDSIEACRKMLDHVKFDETRCEVGIGHLEQYRKKWNPMQNGWSDDPAETGDQHGADAAQTFAMGYDGKWETEPILSGNKKDAWCSGKWP